METTKINLDIESNVAETTAGFELLNTKIVGSETAINNTTKAVERNATAVNSQTTATRTYGNVNKDAQKTALTGGEKVLAVTKAGIGAVNVGAQAFTAYKGVMSLIGVESENLQKTIANVQSVMAMSQGIQGLISAGTQFKTMGKTAMTALQGVKGAVASTGIGLLVIALGVIVAYWDDIKAAVSGVSAEQEKLNESTRANYEMQQEKLDAIGGQENILKLQGKSEREILVIKAKQTDEAIKALEMSIEQSKATKKAQVEAAVRNKSIAMGIIAFLMAPITLLLGLIDSITYGLSLLGVMDATSLTEDFLGGTANLMFDPSEVAEEGDKVIDEQQKTLDKLKNDRAGHQLNINKIDSDGNKKNNENRTKSAQDTAKDLLAFERELWDAKNAMAKEGYEKDRVALIENYKRQREDIMLNEKYTASQKAALIEQNKLNEGIELINLENTENKRLEDVKRAYFDAIIQATQDATERELEINKEKYRRLIDDTIADETYTQEQKANIIKMYEGQRDIETTKIRNKKKEQDLSDNVLYLTSQALVLEDELELIKNNGEKKKELFAQIQQNKADQALIERDKELLDLELTEAQKYAIQQEYENKIRDLNKETADFIKTTDEETATTRAERVEQIMDMVGDGMKLMSDITQMNAEKQVSSINKRYDAEKEKAKGNSKLLNEIEQKRITELNKANKKAFEMKKASDLASAIMDGYKAVLSTYAQTPGGPILKGIAAGISGAFAAVNIAKIASQKFEGAVFNPAEESGGSASAGSEGGGVVAPNFNVVGASGVNQLNGVGAQAPIEAYVVSGAVTTAQQLDRDRYANATL